MAGLALALFLLIGDVVYGWTWWHVGLALINLGFAVQFARGARNWHEPKRALDDAADAS